MKRKVCVVTGSRAEYGLLYWLMKEIQESPNLQLQVIAAGMHLSPKYGLTYREIEKDGFSIDCKVDMLLNSDTHLGVTKSMALGFVGFGEALQNLKPDLMVVLGDRFEIFTSVAAAMIACIPVAHLHGGEVTEGAIDESIRHSITKMSHLHFVAAEEYRKRVIQLGEHPDRVFLVGGLGLDNIKKLKLLDRSSLEEALDFKLGPKNLLVTFHPATLEGDAATHQMTELLTALDTLEDTHLIFTMPNADAGNRALFDQIEKYVANHANSRSYTSLGSLRYLSCIKHVDAVVGNSSSGLLEVPSFLKGTINIGDRQRGRLEAESAINCSPDKKSISDALQKLYSPDFQEKLKFIKNPYGDGGASRRIIEIIRSVSLENILKKSFYDIVF